jgi:hypothetical protein
MSVAGGVHAHAGEGMPHDFRVMGAALADR